MGLNILYLLSALVIFAQILAVMSWKATAFTEYDFKGQNISFTEGNGGCVNIPQEFEKKIKGVSTHDTCVTLWEKKDCKGRAVPIFPGNHGHGRLNEWIFNDKTSSIGPCRYKLCSNCYTKLGNKG